MYGNWIKETTATAGTGTITTAAVSGYERFSTVFNVGDLAFYTLSDGANREFGIGTVGASNTLARTTVLETWVSGVRTVVSPTAITLSGSGVNVYNDVGAKYLPVQAISNATVTASAGSAAIWVKDGDTVWLAGGAVTITSLGTPDHPGLFKWVFVTTSSGATLSPNANLIVPGSASVTLTAGDYFLATSLAGGVSQILYYVKASGVMGTVPALLLTGGTMSGQISMGNNIVSGLKTATFNGEYANGNSGASITIDFNNGQNQSVVLNTATPALTISAPPAVGHYQLRVVQDGTGSRNPSWSGVAYSSTRWISNTGAPAMNTAPNASSMVNFFYDGTSLYQSFGKVGAI